MNDQELRAKAEKIAEDILNSTTIDYNHAIGAGATEILEFLAIDRKQHELEARVSQAEIALYGTQFEFDGRMYVDVDKLEYQVEKIKAELKSQGETE